MASGGPRWTGWTCSGRTPGTNARASAERESIQESEKVVRETPEHRFDRLVRVLESAPEYYGYEEVLDLADAFDRLPVGFMISVDCELEVPSAVRMFAQPEQLDTMIGAMDAIKSLGPLRGESVQNLPDEGEIAAVRTAAGAMTSDLVIVGEQDSDSPKLAGRLDKAYMRELPEGDARVRPAGAGAVKSDMRSSHCRGLLC